MTNIKQNRKRGILEFDSFKQFPEIKAGVSTRDFGSVRKFYDHLEDSNIYQDNFNQFINALNIPASQAVGMKQRHTINIGYIDSSGEHYIENTDGLFTDKKNIFIYVVTADCLPVVFYDPVLKAVGVAHGGYRGLAGGILAEMVKLFTGKNSKPGDIHIGIGPGIGPCCYSVNKDRIGLFAGLSGNYYQVRNSEWFLDLNAIAVQQLVKCGVSRGNIEVSGICTKDNLNRFFSYRGDSDETFGQFATIIGMV